MQLREAELLDLDKAKENAKKKREDIFRNMSEAIREREAILEADDEVLAAHPSMLQYFALKQNSLKELLKQKMMEDGGGFSE